MRAPASRRDGAGDDDDDLVEPLAGGLPRWGLEPERRRGDAPAGPRVEHVLAQWRDGSDCQRAAGQDDGHDRLAALARAAAPAPGETLTLDRLLKLFSGRERLDADDAWACPTCEARVRAVKQLRLAASPPVLVVHLKRFEMLGYHSAKLETCVAVHSTAPVDVGRFIDGDGDGATYYLCAVVNHYGTIEFGHYTAYVTRPASCFCFFSLPTRPSPLGPVARRRAVAPLQRQLRLRRRGRRGLRAVARGLHPLLPPRGHRATGLGPAREGRRRARGAAARDHPRVSARPQTPPPE